MPDPRDSSVYQILFKIVHLLARHPEDVVVKTLWTNEGATFAISVHPEDRHTIFGGMSHIEESLGHFLREADLRLDRRFAMTVEGARSTGDGTEPSAAGQLEETAAMAGGS